MHLIKFFCCLFFSFCLTAAFAQEPVLEYPLSDEQLNDVRTSLLSDSNGNLLVHIRHSLGSTGIMLRNGIDSTILYDSRVLLADNKTEGIKNLKKLRKEQLLSVLYADGILVECYYSKSKNTIFFTETGSICENTCITDVLPLGENEKAATVIEDNGSIYVLSYLEESNNLYLSVKKPGSRLSRIEKTIFVNNYTGGSRKSIPLFSDFFKSKKKGFYFVYDNSHPYPSSLSAVKEKIYHFPGKLIFSMENYNLQTNLIDLSLKDLSYEFYIVPPPVLFSPTDNPAELATSSFLVNDILFKSGGYNDIFFITATNIYTGQVYCNYGIHTNKPELIPNTAFFREAKYNKVADKKRKILDRYLEFSAIGVSHAGGNLYNIEISALDYGASWGQFLLSLALSTAGTYAINTLPDTYGYSIFYFYSKKTLSIKNTLDINTGNFVHQVTDTLSTDLWEAKTETVNNFVQIEEAQKKKVTTFIFKDIIYVSYIDTKEKKLFVYKF